MEDKVINIPEEKKLECRLAIFSKTTGVCHYCGGSIADHKNLYIYGFDPY